MEASRIEELRRQGLAAITYTGGVPNPIPCKLIGVEANELLSLIDAIAASEAARAEAERMIQDGNAIAFVRIAELERERDQARSDLAAARNPDRKIDLFDAHDVDCVNHGAQQMAKAIRRAIDHPGGTLGDSVAQGIVVEMLGLRTECEGWRESHKRAND